VIATFDLLNSENQCTNYLCLGIETSTPVLFFYAFLADRVMVSIRHRCTVANRCKIGPKLLLITRPNRKSHIGFQITCKSST